MREERGKRCRGILRKSFDRSGPIVAQRVTTRNGDNDRSGLESPGGQAGAKREPGLHQPRCFPLRGKHLRAPRHPRDGSRDVWGAVGLTNAVSALSFSETSGLPPPLPVVEGCGLARVYENAHPPEFDSPLPYQKGLGSKSGRDVPGLRGAFVVRALTDFPSRSSRYVLHRLRPVRRSGRWRRGSKPSLHPRRIPVQSVVDPFQNSEDMNQQV